VQGRIGLTERLTLRVFPALVAAGLAFSNVLWSWDHIIYDWGQRFGGRAASADIVIVAIDQQSIDAIGRWPWSRAVHGDLVAALSAAEPRAIGLDIVIAEPSTVQADAHLASAVRSSGRVVLPIVNEQHRRGGQLREILPLPGLSESAAALGHVDRPLDADSISRSVYLKAGLGEPHWPSFALAMLQSANPEFGHDLPGVRFAGDVEDSPFVWRRDHHIWLSYAGPPGHFSHVSYVDVLTGAVPVDRFRDKLVLVGATAAGLGDLLPTPVSGDQQPMPGVEIIANEMDTLLTGRAIEPIRPLAGVLLTALLVLVVMQLLPRLSPRWSLLAAIASVAITLALTVVGLVLVHRWFAPAAAVTGIVGGYILWGWRRLVHTIRYLNQSLQKLEREPAVVDAGVVPEFASTMPFVADLLPVDAGRLEGAGVHQDTQWNRQSASVDNDNRSVNADLNGYVWHAFGVDSGQMGVRWVGAEPPNPGQSKFLAALARRFAPPPEPHSYTPVERMQRRIQQVEAATERLQTMRRFITDTLAQMVDGVIVADNLGRVLMANSSALAMLDEPDDAAIRGEPLRRYWDKFQFDAPDTALQTLRVAIVDREPAQAEVRGPRNKDLLVQVVPFHYGPDDDGIIVDIVDITALRDSERRRREVLSFLSHDLRSPLASILAVTEIVRLKPERLADPKNMERIAANAQRTMRLADDFLQLARAEGADTANFQTVDLIEIIINAGAAVRDQAESKQVNIDYEYAAPVYVHGESGLLERAVTNLVGNAIKYSPDGSAVTIGVAQSDAEAQCWVRDTGYGINPDDIPKLFERFERIHRKEHQHEPGSGLGLVFVKTVVERHQGSIHVDSIIDKGSRFTILLPAVNPIADAAQVC